MYTAHHLLANRVLVVHMMSMAFGRTKGTCPSSWSLQTELCTQHCTPLCSMPGAKQCCTDRLYGLGLVGEIVREAMTIIISGLGNSTACFLLRLDEYAACAQTFCTAMSWIMFVCRIS